MAPVATVVFLHAHPDDEALLTGGTLAMLADGGHSTVVVTATAGGAGLAAKRTQLAERRSAELERSAAALHVTTLVQWEFADSGLHGDAADAFCRVDVDAAAHLLAAVIAEHGAHLLVGYDEHGGYGHPDHVMVHRVARRAAELTGVSLLEATAAHWPYASAAAVLSPVQPLLRRLPWLSGLDVSSWAHAYLPRSQVTHRLDVSPWLDAKRDALAAHTSQATRSSGPPRTLAVLLRLPRPLLRRLIGTEWFALAGVPVPAQRHRDLRDLLPA